MSARLAKLVAGEYPPGLYRWPSRAHPGALGRELARWGWGEYELSGVTGVDRLFAACADALAFPGWFGHTWEGLADCLADLSWLPGSGHVLVWERYGILVDSDGKGWRQAYETLERAMAVRTRDGAPPLYVLLRGTGPDVSPVDGTPIRVLPAVTASAGSRPRRAR